MSLSTPASSFEGDLKYWASCLREVEGWRNRAHASFASHSYCFHWANYGFLAPGVTCTTYRRRWGITSSSSRTRSGGFVEFGVPAIHSKQTQSYTNLLTMLTVATFFSAITATTLKYSVDKSTTRLDTLVNGFWLGSRPGTAFPLTTTRRRS